MILHFCYVKYIYTLKTFQHTEIKGKRNWYFIQKGVSLMRILRENTFTVYYF